MQTTNNIHKKYEEEYNLKNNPFKEFNQREQSKRYRQLHPIDRLVLNLTRLLTMNRYTRFGLLGYIVLLHLLVFFITWHNLVFKADDNEANLED
jgi:homeobox protein cut-like